MKLVHAERLGEAFDSQLVIGVRESYGKTEINTWEETETHYPKYVQKHKSALVEIDTQQLFHIRLIK